MFFLRQLTYTVATILRNHTPICHCILRIEKTPLEQLNVKKTKETVTTHKQTTPYYSTRDCRLQMNKHKHCFSPTIKRTYCIQGKWVLYSFKKGEKSKQILILYAFDNILIERMNNQLLTWIFNVTYLKPLIKLIEFLYHALFSNDVVPFVLECVINYLMNCFFTNTKTKQSFLI